MIRWIKRWSNHSPFQPLKHSFSSSLPHLNQLNIQPPSVKYNRPVGGIRAGILGFLTGLTVTGSYAYLHLFDEYQNACNILLLSVEELKASTLKITGQIKRIENIEKDIKRFESVSITDDQIQKLKSEIKKLIDRVEVQQLELKSNLTHLETDLISHGSLSSSSSLKDDRMC